MIMFTYLSGRSQRKCVEYREEGMKSLMFETSVRQQPRGGNDA